MLTLLWRCGIVALSEQETTENEMSINSATNIIVTEIKNGSSKEHTFEIEAGKYIGIVKDQDCDGRLDIGVEPVKFDEDGDAIEFSDDKFYDLPIEKQLDMVCEREGDRYAAQVSWKVA